MARERPTDSAEQSNFVQPDLGVFARAEAHPLRRSEPLTPSEFKALGRLAEQGTIPLQALLDRRR